MNNEHICEGCPIKEWFGCSECGKQRDVPDEAWEWIKEHAHEYGVVAI